MASLLGLLLSICFLTIVSSQSLSISISSSNDPDVYKNEPLTIECVYTIDVATITGFGFSTPGAQGRVYSGCTISRIASQVTVQKLEPPEMPFEIEDSCQQAYDTLSADSKATVTFNFHPKYAGDYGCATFDPLGSSMDSDLVIVEQLLETPSAPVTGSITDGASYYEGDDIDFTCSSSGGVPSPVWNYTRDGEYVANDGISFVGSRTDRQVVLACEDTSHPNWAGDDSLVSYQATINVYYLFAPMTEKNETFNPGHSYTLRCDTEEYLASDDSLVYSWYRNGETVDGEKEKILVVEQEANATADTFSCRAMPAKDMTLKAVTIKFNIQWDVEASTPTKPTSPPPTKPPKKKPSGETDVEPVKDGNSMTTTIIIIVVVVVVVIVVIVIIVIIVRRRSQQGSAETGKKGENRAQSEDVEQANTDGAADKEEQAKLITNPDEEKPPKEEGDTKSSEETEKQQKD